MHGLSSRSGLGIAEASKSTSTPSRFRKSGLAVALGATAVVAAVPLQTANAAIIYSVENLSTTTPPVVANSTPSLANVSVAGVPLFTVYDFSDTKGNPFLTVTNFGPTTKVVSGATSPYQLTANYGTGVSISSASTYTTVAPAYLDVKISGGNTLPTPGSTYIGFQFNPTGSQVDYGWAYFTVGAGLSPFTLVDLAYEDTGAAIPTGAGRSVPEPTSLALVAVGSVSLLGRRRRRGTTATA